MIRAAAGDNGIACCRFLFHRNGCLREIRNKMSAGEENEEIKTNKRRAAGAGVGNTSVWGAAADFGCSFGEAPPL